jgi:ABC-type transport system involved in cytochrome c biogenesis permease subunit
MKKYFPTLVTALVLIAVAVTLRAPRNTGEFDTVAFGRLPVLVNGRVKPLDTVARTSLLMLQGHQRVTAGEGARVSPAEWLLDVLYRPHVADHYQVFEVTHPELLALLDLTAKAGAGHKRFSLQQFNGKLGDLDRQARLADGTERALRTAFQRAVVQLRDSIALYQRLQGSVVAFGNDDFLAQLAKLEQRLPASGALPAAEQNAAPFGDDARQLGDFGRMFATMDSFSYFRPIPPAKGAEATAWRTVGATWSESLTNGRSDPAALAYAALGRAWRDRDANAFNQMAQMYRRQLEVDFPSVMTKSAAETRFNSSQPFYTSAILYVAAFLCGILSWLRWPEAMRRVAFILVAVAFGLTTLGIATRMWLEARPPVTNLYSSALFVGWGAVALCIILEYAYKNSIGSVTAGLVGFAALVIAHHLALGGDTMEMMRAVLDSNFWLATHVVTIAVGYSATFLAGFLALIYVLRSVFTRSLDEVTATALGRMIYGVVCFATLFSFVGTILGGIWADQSWGRFWGWDPKENGALLIVIWNAIILHVRWAGLVKLRGLACLAIFGNIVTAWSWFGVNMLGVGLHSYGFMDAEAPPSRAEQALACGNSHLPPDLDQVRAQVSLRSVCHCEVSDGAVVTSNGIAGTIPSGDRGPRAPVFTFAGFARSPKA